MRRSVRIPPKRDVITTESVAIGSLALALHEAQRRLLDTEAQLDQLLDSLYGPQGWVSYEPGPTFELDIYEVDASPAALNALMRAGFRTVTEHSHSREKFLSCACPRRQKESS